MKKIYFTVIIFLSCLGISNAQTEKAGNSDYDMGIGLRISPLSDYDLIALDFKAFISREGAITANLGYGTNSYTVGRFLTTNYDIDMLSFSGAYQHHFNIGNIDGFRWFVGGGATALYSSSKLEDYDGIGAGLFLTGGVEYKFSNIPMCVSIDFRPTAFLIKPDHLSTLEPAQVGLIGRYTF